jgi:hypothetical protein
MGTSNAQLTENYANSQPANVSRVQSYGTNRRYPSHLSGKELYVCSRTRT